MNGAAVAVRQNRILRAYREASATVPERARTPEDLGLRSSSFALRALARRGVLRAAEKDRYWLDEGTAQEFLARRRALTFVLLAIRVVVALVVALT